MGNPFLKRVEASGSIGHGLRSEKRVARTMGARLHPNSGAMRGAKSDASLTEANFRLEMKSSMCQFIKLEIGWLAKIAKEALSHGQRPAVVISFVDFDGKPALRHHADWVLIPREVFKELTDAAQK